MDNPTSALRTALADEYAINTAIAALEAVKRGYKVSAAEAQRHIDELRSFRDRARQALALPQAVPTDGDAPAYREAVSLAMSLWRRYYRDDAPDWKPLEDIAGVLSQIDNMVAGLVSRYVEAPQATPLNREALIDTILSAGHTHPDGARRAIEHAREFCTGRLSEAQALADRILALAKSDQLAASGVQRDTKIGTTDCPLCRRDYPHLHTAEEVEAGRELYAEPAASGVQGRQGCKLVPREATPEMVEAFWRKKPGSPKHSWRAMYDAAPTTEAPSGWRPALVDIAAERQRQISVEGWTLEHDDGHTNGEIAEAASAWASNGQRPVVWSWASDKASKPRRRQLVIAGALIVAEIERLDRMAAAPTTSGEG